VNEKIKIDKTPSKWGRMLKPQELVDLLLRLEVKSQARKNKEK
jgi:hypothetical protein